MAPSGPWAPPLGWPAEDSLSARKRGAADADGEFLYVRFRLAIWKTASHLSAVQLTLTLETSEILASLWVPTALLSETDAVARHVAKRSDCHP